MARLAEHEKDCIERLGEAFTEVHLFLDQYVEKYPIEIFEEQHRSFLHNKNGIEQVRKKWGNKAAVAARLHIARDEFGSIPKTFRLYLGEILLTKKPVHLENIQSEFDKRWSKLDCEEK